MRPRRSARGALFDAGIPPASFGAADAEATSQRLKGFGVVFKTPPAKMGPVTIAIFDDTCGKVVQIDREDRVPRLRAAVWSTRKDGWWHRLLGRFPLSWAA